MKENGMRAQETLESSWIELNVVLDIWISLKLNSEFPEKEPVLNEEIMALFRVFYETMVKNEQILKFFETFFKRKFSYFVYEDTDCKQLSEKIISTIELALLLSCILGKHYPISMILIIRREAAYYFPHDHSFFKDDINVIAARIQKKYGRIVSQVVPATNKTA